MQNHTKVIRLFFEIFDINNLCILQSHFLCRERGRDRERERGGGRREKREGEIKRWEGGREGAREREAVRDVREGRGREGGGEGQGEKRRGRGGQGEKEREGERGGREVEKRGRG